MRGRRRRRGCGRSDGGTAVGAPPSAPHRRASHRQAQGLDRPKDVILWVAGQLDGGTNAIIEYIGPGARTISATGKATISNMGAEVGATTSLFPYDEHMAVYLQATGRGALVPVVEKNRHLLEPDAEVEAAPRNARARAQARSLHARTAHRRTALARPRATTLGVEGRTRGSQERLHRHDLPGAHRKLHQLFVRT